MTASASEKMEFKDERNEVSGESAAQEASGTTFSGELDAPQWSVMTFEEVAVRGLTYAEAARWLDNLRAQNVHGLCIVTDEAANRFSGKD